MGRPKKQDSLQLAKLEMSGTGLRENSYSNCPVFFCFISVSSKSVSG